MPNIKSAKKRVLISKAENERNKAAKSALKTTVKKFDSAITSGDKDLADAAFKAAVKSVDKAWPEPSHEKFLLPSSGRGFSFSYAKKSLRQAGGIFL